MTDKLRAAAQQALKAFEVATTPLAKDRQEVLQAREALRAALAEPEQEPTAWCWVVDGVRGPVYHGSGPDADIVARAAAAEFPRTVQFLWDGPPPRREWQSLTRTEILKLANEAAPPEDVLWVRDPDQCVVSIASAVEAALRERNQ